MTAILDGTPQADFHSDRYLRNTARRLEHLATLGFDYTGKRLLELGAGIGDLSTFFSDRGALVTATEGRPDNLAIMNERLAAEDRVVETALLDLDPPPPFEGKRFDIVVSYGLLYHLSDPAAAIEFMSDACAGMLLLETMCAPGAEANPNPNAEDPTYAVTARSGMGCRPTRRWVFDQLETRFEHVYTIRTTPSHREFPRDWAHPATTNPNRGIFVASRTPIDHPELAAELLEKHRRV